MIIDRNSPHLRPRPLMLLGLLALSVGLFSCTEDAFSQLVEVPLPEHLPQPVLSLALLAGDSSYQAVVGRSYGILDESPYEEDRTTNLRLFRNDVLISNREGVVGDHLGINVIKAPEILIDTIANDEATYRALIEIREVGSATATQIMPAQPRGRVVSFIKDGAVDIDGYRSDVINVAVDDPAGSADYYQFRVERNSTNRYCSYDSLGREIECRTYPNIVSYNVSSPDPILRPTDYTSVVASDRSFDGTRREFRLEVNGYGEEQDSLYVVIEGLTEDGYRYLTSKYAAEEADGNPFAEPVTVHGNIEGGLGIFMLSSRVRLLVER